MSVETERKIKLWVLGATCSLLLGMTGWGVVDFITSERALRKEIGTKLDSLNETTVGFISKQNEINDSNKKDHELFNSKIDNLDRKINSAELELYRLTGKRLIETTTRGNEPTEYEKLIDNLKKKE